MTSPGPRNWLSARGALPNWPVWLGDVGRAVEVLSDLLAARRGRVDRRGSLQAVRAVRLAAQGAVLRSGECSAGRRSTWTRFR